MSFETDYVLFIFLASLGVVQLAALKNRLRGLCFIRNPVLNLALALGLVAGSFLWFFISEPRNLPDTGDGLDGNQQAMYSVAAAISAVLFTLAVTSLINLGIGRGDDDKRESGLQAMRHATYFSAVRRTLGRLWKH